MSYVLAASAEMLFTELPFVDRVRAIHARGLGVEIWNWTTKDLDELAATGANFTSMTGYIEGDLLEADGIARFLETAEQSIVASRIIDADRLNVHGTGLDGNGQAIRPRETVTAAERRTAQDTLSRLADLGAKHDAVFMLENLNLAVDHPRNAVRASGGHHRARVEHRQPPPATQPRSVSRPDWRGEPCRTRSSGTAVDRRDSGSRRSGKTGAWDRRNQLFANSSRTRHPEIR